jgi:hypothetical protein
MPPTTIGHRSDPGPARLTKLPALAGIQPETLGSEVTASRASVAGWRTAIAASLSTVRRQGDAIAADLARARRLPALVARAGAMGRWTEADRRAATDAARSLVRVGAWCVILAVPGGFLLVPLLIGAAGRA